MSDDVRTIGVRFVLEEDGPSTVFMDLTARGKRLVTLVSVRVGDDGRLLEWTKWTEGLPRVIRWNAATGRAEELLGLVAATAFQAPRSQGGRFLRPEG